MPGLQDAVRPIEDVRVLVGIVFEVENDEIQSARAEQFVMIVIVGAVVTTVVVVSAKMGFAKKLVVELSVAGRITDRALVMIAHGHTVGDSVLGKGRQRVLQ